MLNYYSATKPNEIDIIFIKQSLSNKLPFICFNNGMQQGMKLYEKKIGENTNILFTPSSSRPDAETVQNFILYNFDSSNFFGFV